MAQNTRTTGLAGLINALGLPSFREVVPFQRIAGYAAYPYPIKLENGKAVTEFVWQIGARAPAPGTRDLVLLQPINGNEGKGFQTVGIVPAKVAERYGVRPGDWVEGFSMGTQPIQLSPDRPREDLPVLEATASLVGQMLDQERLQLRINDLPPKERPLWRYGVSAEDVRYPGEPYDLGHDPNDQSVQTLLLFAEIARGGKIVFASDAGGGKTRTGFEVLRNIARHNRGRPVYLVMGLIGERPEDLGENWEDFEAACSKSHGVAGMELLCYDTDFMLVPYEVVRISQLVVARAQRLAELSATLPVEERFDVVVFLDSGKRILDSMDHVGLGEGRTLPGGMDPFSGLLLQALIQTGRYQMIPDPEGRKDFVSLTSIFTLLVDHGRRSGLQLSAQKADVNLLLPFQPPKDNWSVLPALPDWEEILLRWKEKLQPAWRIKAIQLLHQKLAEVQSKTRGTGKQHAGIWLGKFLKEHRGLATVALKFLVPKLLLGEETGRARGLIKTGQIPTDDMAGVEMLVQELVIPTDWGPKIWHRLSLEGLVESLPYLQAKQLVVGDGVSRPKDLHQLQGVDAVRATKLWERFAGEGLVLSLDHLLQKLLRANGEIESAKEVAKALGITLTRAEEIWRGVSWADEAPEELVVETATVEPNNGLLTRTRELIDNGQVFADEEALAMALTISFDVAGTVLGLLTLEDFAVMARNAGGELHKVLTKRNCGRAEAIQHFFNLPFGDAKKVAEMSISRT